MKTDYECECSHLKETSIFLKISARQDSTNRPTVAGQGQFYSAETFTVMLFNRVPLRVNIVT